MRSLPGPTFLRLPPPAGGPPPTHRRRSGHGGLSPRTSFAVAAPQWPSAASESAPSRGSDCLPGSDGGRRKPDRAVARRPGSALPGPIGRRPAFTPHGERRCPPPDRQLCDSALWTAGVRPSPRHVPVASAPRAGRRICPGTADGAVTAIAGASRIASAERVGHCPRAGAPCRAGPAMPRREELEGACLSSAGSIATLYGQGSAPPPSRHYGPEVGSDAGVGCRSSAEPSRNSDSASDRRVGRIA